MKKRIVRYLGISFLIGILFNGFSVLAQNYDIVSPVGGEPQVRGAIPRSGPSGEKYVFEMTDLDLPKGGGLFSDVIIKGSGQLLYQKGKDSILLTANKVVSINKDKLVLKISGKLWEYKINRKTFWGKLGLVSCTDPKVNDETRFCDGTKTTEWSDFKPSDMVIVVSHIEELHTALTVRKGSLLLKPGHSITGAANEKGYIPVDYECQEVR